MTVPQQRWLVLTEQLRSSPAHVAAIERDQAPRWVWSSTSATYPKLLSAGVHIARCHDLDAAERLLLGHEQRWVELADLESTRALPDADQQPTLFDADHRDPAPTAQSLTAAYQAQLDRISAAATTHAGFPLLVAAESAGWLAAAELTAVGVPWDVEVHDRLLADLLGTRTSTGRPSVLAELAQQIALALEDPRVNPDSTADLLRSLRRAGVPATSTSRHELARYAHPAIPLIRRYKELSRIWVANGWSWAQTWVHHGRFRPEYIPAGVVSGRWATRGGGALQIPRSLRDAVRAPRGRVLVIADAGQVEPRVLAAMSGDPAMIEATRADDLYREVARLALGDETARAEAKLALLSAMYGGGTGSPALSALRRRFPGALNVLEAAARAGEDGGGAHSILGRACPPAKAGWLDGLSDPDARARTRARGRFTRNYVVQASAADWAAVLVAGIRTRLRAAEPDQGWRPQLVFFQHDEVIVETTPDRLELTLDAIHRACADATALVLGDVGVTIPLPARAVVSYAEKG